jgi:hypothetical protein
VIREIVQPVGIHVLEGRGSDKEPSEFLDLRRVL